MKLKICDLMQQTGVKFGTSGARGLASEITDQVGYAYTRAFLDYLKSELPSEACFSEVAVGGDLRPSTPRIKSAAIQAIIDSGLRPVDCGFLPSPALALYGINGKIPTVMVTGSHIPEDRNGIKYTTSSGEISKRDEAGIKEMEICVDSELFNQQGFFCEAVSELEVDTTASQQFVERYLSVFPEDLLSGKRIGVYEHSAVGRDLLSEIISGLGGESVRLDRSTTFVPVDTEAIREEDHRKAAQWVAQKAFDAIISTDGDSDRPLICGEDGKWIRGDVCGILTAEFLKADGVATPVSCNTALEKSNKFPRVIRTRIGSPYVIEGMQRLAQEGADIVVGYEANGGFLMGSDVPLVRGLLPALPTRDAVIVHLAVLALSIDKGVPVSSLAEELPQRFTASDRLKEFPPERSAAIVSDLSEESSDNRFLKIESLLTPVFGHVMSVDSTDGLRITFANHEIIHLRPSGNAPEFRCYTEAKSLDRAQSLLDLGLETMKSWRERG